MSEPTRTPPNPCPECGTVVDSASHVENDATPTRDDVTMCLYCGAWLGFTEDLRLRLLSKQEIVDLPREIFDTLVRVGRIRAEVMQGHPRARR